MSAIIVLFAIAQIASIASKASAIIGVSALDLDSGRAVHIRGDERFPMGSVYKVPIAIAVLHACDRGDLNLDRDVTIEPKDFAPGFSPIRDKAKGRTVTMTVRMLVDAAVRVSDNTAADVLQHLAGGGLKITAELRSVGIETIRVDRTEKRIAADIDARGVPAYYEDPRDTATPDSMIAMLRKICLRRDGLSPASHDMLVEMMTNSRNPDRIRKGVPAGTIIAHKTGTMPGVRNDVAILTSADGKHHIAIVILTKGETSSIDDAAIGEIARIVYEDFLPLT
jgi:beta-lactamase class A